jgi:hypothetical protein
MKQCGAIKRDGTPCRSMALDSGLCWAHDPLVRDRADAARKRGGENRSNLARASARMPKDMKSLGERILAAFDRVETGELDPARAHAMARLVAAFVQLHQVGELEGRLAALETAANGGKGTLAGLVSTYRRPS